MDFRTKLSQRIGMYDINEILRLTHDSESRKQELYDLVIGEDQAIGYHATWIFTHFSSQDNEWLYNKQDQLIDEVLACKHGGKRRVMLNLLYRQPFPNPPRVDFLDFCLERMMSGEELPGVKSLCMKIAYELCRPIPELMQELKTMLAMMEGDLVPSIQAVRKNILKAMQRGKSLQKY
ncbi:hypothetical protein CLV62_107147 [Dysgonomonas alginatilytica]|uniref:Uncharacterized protein n=1 Tax=Dysgonomonas alginatilytica TaxID=1605892 RepID=A0A2V3PQ76_9BACT|nr:hypothetical protein [Dysgonomonas alginatilytica]PXV65550.1 hypothetical protein CLV62_107147 [Dysgonomonas alginatilytica]